MLFLYVLRHTLHQAPQLSPLLLGLSDAHLRPALTAFIDTPGESWSIERMAALACQSRSAFAERFTRLVALPPMEFVTIWRMQQAAGLLTRENANMPDVAIECGYESEAAFRKAFKRVIGIAPGKLRRSGR